MKQTEQYKLNQWELSDHIRMEDFNADNAKIEAQLAWLKKKLVDLAFHVGQLTAAEIQNHSHYPSFRLLRCEGFMSDMPSVNVTGDAKLENNTVVLRGPRSSGGVNVNIVMESGEPLTEAFVWIHHSYGEGHRVVPKINGVELTPLYNHRDFAAATDIGCRLYAYHYAGAPIQDITAPLSLELSRDTDTDGALTLYDFCALRL